jgi:type IV pilus assembly protein PilA
LNENIAGQSPARKDRRGNITTMKLHKVHQHHEAGFTLIELLIVMSVMLILMTLAVPELLHLRKQGNETSAQASVKAISEAELDYNKNYGTFTCTLSALGGDPKSGAPSPLAAQVLAADLASGQKAGYTFAITNCDKTTINNEDRFNSFEVTAVPQSVGKTGDRGFCADETTTRYDPAGGVNCTQAIR